MPLFNNIFKDKPVLALLICLVVINIKAMGQCTIPVNTFANTQQVFAISLLNDATVANASNAVSGNLVNFSSLYGGTLGTATQFLKFPATVAAGIPVTIKLSIPTSLLSVLGSVEIQPFTNLHNPGIGWAADAAGAATTNASLLGLLNGAGSQYVTITPKTTGGINVAYDGVWIKISGITVAQTVDVYGAYTTATGSSSNPAVPCNPPVDVLAGVRAGTVVGGIANATGVVINPLNAIDNDPAYSTYSELSVGAQVLSEVYHTTVFNSLSQTGDFVRMILQKPGGGLLDLNAITNFTIQLYNGSTPVGTAIRSNSGLLSISLLPGTAGNEKYQLDLVPPTTAGIFDRAEVVVGGLAGVGLVPGLRIYDVKRVVPPPAINIDGNPAITKTICQGTTSTFTVSNSQTCTTYKWYDAATGGNFLFTGASYTPAAAGLLASNTYYVAASRTGCTETTTRTPVSLIVNPAPAITPNLTPKVCSGTTTGTIAYTGAVNTPTTYSINWDPAAITTGFTNIVDAVLPAGAITVAVPSATLAGQYNGILYVKNANGCTSTGQPFILNIDARSTQPVIALTP